MGVPGWFWGIPGGFGGGPWGASEGRWMDFGGGGPRAFWGVLGGFWRFRSGLGGGGGGGSILEGPGVVLGDPKGIFGGSWVGLGGGGAL